MKRKYNKKSTYWNKFDYTDGWTHEDSSVLNQYWSRHKKEIIKKALDANPGFKLTESMVKYQFVDNVKDYVDYQGFGVRAAIEKTLRGREFKSQSTFYAEGVREQLEARYANEIGWNSKLQRFTDLKHKIVSDRWQTIKYVGTIEVNGSSWTGYSIVTGAGKVKYYYESGSPKSGTMQTMLLDERLA